MTINEVKQALGSWELRLAEFTPRSILDSLTYFGHVAVMPNRLDPVQYGDNLLTAARYVGVLRKREAGTNYTLSGSSMAFWLGDEDDKGDVFETPVVVTGASFAASMAALLPTSGAITSGTINSVAGTYTGTHQYQTPRKALTYVADIFGAEWRVNGNGTLDAGTVAQLYVTTPKAIIMRRNTGRELQRVSMPGNMQMETQYGDYTTRVLLLAEGEGEAIATGAASLGVVPFKDIHGNNVKMTRVVSESETGAGNANTRAQLILNLFSSSRNAVSLTTDAYDVKGDFVVGDAIDVWDPDSGFYDPAREVYWEGQPINPLALRCIELSWPVPAGWTVAFRDINGVWIDLSPYYIPESGQTTVTVGALQSSLIDVGGDSVVGRGGQPDSTVPGVPAFTGFSTGAYQSTSRHTTKAVIRAQWSTPLNVDSSTIQDGDHYEIRYRVNQVIGYNVPWDVLDASYDWDELGAWDTPISDPVQASPQWLTAYIGWGTNTFTVTELTPGVAYELQIRAVDGANPPNQGAWSASSFVITLGDVIAPSAPASPTVAASRIAIQVTHNLGKASGGTFNLEPDLDHLEVHVGGSVSFFPDSTTKVGELVATAGMVLKGIPAVGTFQIEQTEAIWVRVVAVDRDGNKSGASPGVQATADLIDSSHISDLTVSKLTAGTISATWVNAGRITTGDTGQRAELNSGGLKVYDELDNVTAVVGQVAVDDYGIALINNIGQLVRLSDLIFGIQQTSDDSSGVMSVDFPYGDLDDGTTGPFIDVVVGETGRLMAIMTCSVYWSVSSVGTLCGVGGRFSVELTGANSLPAGQTHSGGYSEAIQLSAGTFTRSGSWKGTAAYYYTGLNPGLTRLTMKYAKGYDSSFGTGTCTFSERSVAGFPY